MSESFLDRLGTQLLHAERDLTSASAGASRPRRRWRSRKLILTALIPLAAAVPALALTEPWQPVLGRGHDQPTGTSLTPVPSDATSILGVLRRPQTPQDRSPTALRLLRGVGQEFAGVRLDSVRLITLTPGHHALVMSSQSVGHEPGLEVKGIGNPVCVVFSFGGTCGDAHDLRAHGIVMSMGLGVLGLVPDGVARVVLSFAGGKTATAEVHDNAFSITDAATTTRTLPAPAAPTRRPRRPLVSGSPAADGPGPIGSVVMTAPFTVKWLNPDGQVIGPPKTR